jgi:hypothetical protein
MYGALGRKPGPAMRRTGKHVSCHGVHMQSPGCLAGSTSCLCRIPDVGPSGLPTDPRRDLLRTHPTGPAPPDPDEQAVHRRAAGAALPAGG